MISFHICNVFSSSDDLLIKSSSRKTEFVCWQLLLVVWPQATQSWRLSSVQFSCSVVPNSLRPHGLQHARLPCPSPIPGACSNSCPSSRWSNPTILFSVVPFFSYLQSSPASGSFPISQFFAGSIPGSGRSPGERNGYPLQYSCLENSMDNGAWQATVQWVAKSWTLLND